MSGLTAGGTDLEERRLIAAANAGDRQAFTQRAGATILAAAPAAHVYFA
jgi:hypothetical protein